MYGEFYRYLLFFFFVSFNFICLRFLFRSFRCNGSSSLSIVGERVVDVEGFVTAPSTVRFLTMVVGRWTQMAPKQG